MFAAQLRPAPILTARNAVFGMAYDPYGSVAKLLDHDLTFGVLSQLILHSAGWGFGLDSLTH